MRKISFVNDEYYHIFNRGVDKREVFSCDYDYQRFLKSLDLFNNVEPIYSLYLNDWRKNKGLLEAKPLKHLKDARRLVEIIAYCLNPNHFHLILKQLEENGISEFMKRVSGGYTGYYNRKYDRSGSLFQWPFKSSHIDSNELLLYLSVYVNANHQIHSYPEKDWPCSSFLDYTGKRDGKLCNKEIILGQFNNNFSEYEKYLNDNAEYFKEKKEMEKYLLE